MVLLETSLCRFGTPAVDFRLPDVEGKHWSLADCQGEKATLIMFICNHCPYVQAIQTRLVRDTEALLAHGVKSVAIMPNDPADYPEDSLENMRRVAAENRYPFPYLFDATQAVARGYDAVCTPDFFGYNAKLELQYRGRLDASRRDAAPPGARRDLYEAMLQIAATGRGPAEQIASMGCSIKWRKAVGD